jgi:hypothetical protein
MFGIRLRAQNARLSRRVDGLAGQLQGQREHVEKLTGNQARLAQRQSVLVNVVARQIAEPAGPDAFRAAVMAAGFGPELEYALRQLARRAGGPR